MDVVALAQSGIDNAVATLGTATTRRRTWKDFSGSHRKSFFVSMAIAPGRDAAWRALEVALPVLRDGLQIGFLFLPDGEDPDSIVRAEGADAFRERIKQATPLPDFLFDSLIVQTNLTRLDGRARLVELCKPLLGKLNDGVLKELMFERLSSLSRLDTDKLSRTTPQPTPTQRNPHKPAKPATLSPVATAIALLLQYPDKTHGRTNIENLAGLNLPGVDLLIELVDLTDAEPELKTANLLERFRQTTHHTHLEKLSAWDHLVLDDNVVEVFDETVRTLAKKRLSQEIDELLAESRERALSEIEKQRLLELTQQHKSN